MFYLLQCYEMCFSLYSDPVLTKICPGICVSNYSSLLFDVIMSIRPFDE